MQIDARTFPQYGVIKYNYTPLGDFRELQTSERIHICKLNKRLQYWLS